MKYIFTCQPTAGKIALSEFKQEDPTFSFETWLEPGVGIISSDLSQEELKNLVECAPIIFVRHIFPIDFEVERPENSSELASIMDGYLLSVLNTQDSFSIQARTLDTDLYKSYRNNFRDQLNERLSQHNLYEDRKQGNQILSVFISNKTVYAGYSYKDMNLSNWNGGMMHCAKEGSISRAEFKLLEAIEVFHLDMNQFKKAADLGAAPGGWTHALLNHNLSVTAIDPAKMDSELMKHPKLTHYREMTQTYLARGLDEKFDLIVNDMKMDVVLSASITNEFEHVLNDNGLIIMTFKLPNKYSYLNVKRGIEELSKVYDFVVARQLFHNRSEVTVVFKKRS